MDYRKDIQILRGGSVLLVVLYHLHAPIVKSGFLGVDVFFVISGFLMASMYDPANKLDFFRRRARRLLPLYYVTLGLVVFSSAFIVLPIELYQVIGQSLYGLSFTSNLGFWMQNSYFSRLEFNPLLHLWSIGVEIQYYLMVPLFYSLYLRSKWNLVFVGILSAFICFYLVGVSNDVLELLGKYSYSIYLVHFPIIVLFFYKPFSGTVLQPENAYELTEIIFLIALASILSYHCVEVPSRKLTFSKQNIVAPMSVLAVTILVYLSPNVLYTNKELNIFAGWRDRGVYRCGKLNRILHPADSMCKITHTVMNPRGRVLLLGNSHADSIKGSFAKSAELKNYDVYFMVSNTPLMPGDLDSEQILLEAQKKKIDEIVLHYSPGAVTPKTILNFIKKADISNIHVSFILPVPTYEQHIPKALWNNLRQNASLPVQSIKNYYRFNDRLITALNQSKYPVKIYDVASIFCRDTCLTSFENGKPMYFDSGHLTLSGARLLEPLFERIFFETQFT